MYVSVSGFNDNTLFSSALFVKLFPYSYIFLNINKINQSFFIRKNDKRVGIPLKQNISFIYFLVFLHKNLCPIRYIVIRKCSFVLICLCLARASLFG